MASKCRGSNVCCTVGVENLLPSGDVPVGEITEQLEPEWPVKE